MSIIAQRALQHVPAELRVALGAIGFTSVVAQIVLLRQLFVASYGNELSLGLTLAVWLFWTAAGSAIFGRLLPRIARRRLLALLQIAIAVALFASVLFAQSSRTWWNATPGEALGPVPIILTALVTLSIFCPISGWLFSVGARAYAEASQRSLSEGGSATYLLEATGSAVGGVLASIILIRFLDSFQIASIVAVINLLVASQLLIRGRTLRRVIAIVLIASGAGAVLIARRLESRSVSRVWPGFSVIAVTNSRYGSLAVIETEGSRSVIQNGLMLFTVPDLASAEEAVHFPLLEHPAPRSVLLIGGGLNGSVAEILKHPTVERVDYVELDPAVLKLTHDYFPQAWSKIAADARVHTHQMDGRLYVKRVSQRFDVIIVNLPEPQTAQLNRFYTEEFFREAKDKLSLDGLLAFHLRGAEEYISPELAEFLRCIYATLGRVFPEVAAIPGENVHFFGSRRYGALTTDPQVLLYRLRERGIRTTYFREYYLPFRMAPERVASLKEQLAIAPHTRVNRDFAPIAYYFDVALWSGQFSSSYRDAFRKASSIPFRTVLLAFAFFIALCAVALGRPFTYSLRAKPAAVLSVAATGLTVMGTEILLLLGFQAVYGYVFDELAVIVAGFMAGMAMGSWLALRPGEEISEEIVPTEMRRLAMTQAAVGLSPLIVLGILAAVEAVRGTWLVPIMAHAAFLLIAILCGFAGGYQFSVAMRVYSAASTGNPGTPGTLYAIDLLGAAIGAIAISAYIVPVFGFMDAAVLMLTASVVPIVFIVAALRRFNAAHE